MRTRPFCRQLLVARPLRRSLKSGFNLTLAALLAAATLPAFAQTVAAPAAEPAVPASNEVLALSPFVVDATKDNGYAATNTQAGSRLNSRLLDTPSAISVMTSEFLKDIGASNIDTAIAFGTNIEVNRNDDDSGYRIRGIKSSVSRSRNMFLVSGDQIKSSSDLYNVDRITSSRGPNAILYGNADPAGVIDVSTKKANLNRNQGEFAQQVDSYETGLRVSADWNQVIIPGRLALRVDAMYQDVNGMRMNSPQRDQNIYLAGTALLVDKDNYKLSVSFDYENDHGNNVYMRVNQPTEQYTYWLSLGRPTVGAYSTSVRPTYATGTRAFNTNSQIVWVGGATQNIATMDWKNSGVSNSASIVDPNTGVTSTAGNLSLQDTTEWPLYLNLYGLTSSREETNARYRTISLTQQFGQDLYLEAAYNDFVGSKWRPWSGGGYTNVMIDPNQFLPNGAANPNVGKYFIDKVSNAQDYAFIDSTVRVGLAYKLDLAKKVNPWFGRHSVALSYDHRKTGRFIDNYAEVNTTPLASATAAAQIGAVRYLTNTQNWISRRFYLDPAAGIVSAGDVNVPIRDNGVNSELLRVRAPTVTKGVSTSFSEALQSFWLKDRLVTTVGFRQDEADSYGIRASTTANPNQDSRGVFLLNAYDLLNSTPVANFKVNTKSYGAVLHVTDNVSIFGNKSDNFSPDVTRTDVYGNVIPPTVGEGQDFGLKFQFFGGRLSVALGRYVNSKENTILTGGNAPGNNFSPIWDALGVASTDPRYPGKGGQFNYTFSNESKGTEVEITYNPTPNWRIRFVADKNDSVFSSYAPQYEDYYKMHQATWEAADQNLSSGGTTIAQNLQSIKDRITLNNAQKASATGVTPYQGNIVTSYQFPKSSVLKGFTIGASGTYRAAPIIGFPNKRDGVVIVADTSRPYKSRDVYTTGLLFAYETRITARNIKWRMQLNVNNLLDDQKPIPYAVRAQDGAVTNAQLPAPRQLIFSNSFSF